MSANNIVRILGLLAAVVAALISGGFPYDATVIAILGLVGGYYVGADDRTSYLVLAVALHTVMGALSGFGGASEADPGIGVYLSNILGQVSALISAGAVTVIVVHIYEELTA